MILTEIDHIAIAVNDLEEAIAYYEEALEEPEPETTPEEN